MSLKSKIEAVLFLTAKPIKAQAMARIVNADVQLVRQALLELVHDYEERQGGLEIAADEDGYSFQVKDEYASLMDEFLPVEMSAALIRTLSAIAIKQPIAQSEIIRIRGAGAYEHIKELVNRELVGKKEGEGGRSPILSTTKKFQEYFRLTKEGKDLRNFLKQAVKKAADGAAAAAGQLVIPSVVTPEADTQLNNHIFLETQDMAEASGESTVADASSSETQAAPVAESQPAAAFEDAGTEDTTVSETATPDVEAAAAATVMDDSQHQEIPAAAEETAVVKASQSEPVADLPPPPQAEEAEEAPQEAEEQPNITLSKLAAAADVKDPEPIQAVSSEQATEEPAPPVESGAETATGSTMASRSTVQSHKAKDGPAMGTNKNGKKPPKLSDLLEKQRELEKALEKAREDSVQQKKIDFSLPPAKPSDNSLPS